MGKEDCVVVLWVCTLCMIIALFFSSVSASNNFRHKSTPPLELPTTTGESKSGPGWIWNCTGKGCDHDVVTRTKPGLVLMGGGTDVDDAFIWQLQRAGGGDFVVIRTDGTDAYNDYIYQLSQPYGGLNSVSTFVITRRQGANQPFVVERIRNAEALFIAGGDQSTYIKFWENTQLQGSLQHLLTKGVTIGGTSAGLAVLGQWIYTAFTGSVTSAQALRNPYNKEITLGTNFLKIANLKNLITDTHFYQRDRMGRELTFMARLLEDGDISTNAFGIAVSERTAVLVNETGIGRIVNQQSSGYMHAAYFLRTTQKPTVCEPNRTLSISSIAVARAELGDEFDLGQWRPFSPHVTQYMLDVRAGSLTARGNGGNIY